MADTSKPTIKGPRPLALHLANSQALWDGVSHAGVGSLSTDIWHQDIKTKLDDFTSKLSGIDEKVFQERLAKGALGRKQELLSGINTYLSYETPPLGGDAKVCHEIGSVKLRDYGGDGQPVLLAPSLINPHYILDLMQGRSLVAYLKNEGYRPFLIEWSSPQGEEKLFGISDYVCERFLPLLEYVAHLAVGAVPLIGYCMGGTLSVALTAKMQHLVSKLVLLAAPWGFSTGASHPGSKHASEMLAALRAMPQETTIGVDVLQTFFTNVDPTLNDRKFREYAKGKYSKKQADFFAAMETWVNSGGPLARNVGIECLEHWYRGNLPEKGAWLIAGEAVDLGKLKCPVFVSAPEADRLVPQASAFAIISQLENVTKHVPPSGHIGMVVGNRAEKGLWNPLVEWLKR